MADVPGKFYRATKVRTGVSPSSPGAIEGEVTPPLNPPGGALNSVGLTMPSAFTVANSPLTANGTIGVTGAGTVGQYIRGDGSLADFPQTSGGGSSVSYYLNGSVNQGTIGGVAYRELNKVPVLGTGTDFSINADGYIASFITDAGDPNLLEIPGGNWNFETYFSASSSGGTPTFYVELYKVSGTTATLIASSSATPEFIAFGTTLTSYFSTLAVPQTTLALTDRLAIRYYVNHSGRTITLHTEDNHLCQVITTFTNGLTALNGLTAQVQNFAVGTSGTDFNIASATATHTFNLPTASATNRGALSSADWSTFNNKQNALGYTPVPETRTITINGVTQDLSANRTFNVGTVTSVGLSSATSGVTIGSTPVTTSGTITLAIATASGSQNGLLSSTDWTTFNSKQPAGNYVTTDTAQTISGEKTFTNSIILKNSSTGLVLSSFYAYRLQIGGLTFSSEFIFPATSRFWNLPDASGTIALVGGAGVGTVTSVAALTLGTSGTDLSSTVANSTTTPVITLNVPTASATNRGALSSSDWTTFNNKQNALSNPVTGTGTTNYLPKFTGSTTIGNSIVFDNGTNVSIGATSTNGKLTVVSNPASWNNFANAQLRLGATISGNSISMLFTDGNNSNGWFGYQDNAVSANRYFYWSANDGASQQMQLNSSGNLLVGTTTDNGARLQVEGTASFNFANNSSGITFSRQTIGQLGSIINSGSEILYQGTGSVFINADSDSNGTSANREVKLGNRGVSYMTLTSDGNVGIGTPSPSSKLEIVGDAEMLNLRNSTTSTITGRIGVRTDGAMQIYSFQSGVSYKPVIFGVDGSFLSAGNLLVGTTTDNGARLQVSGLSSFTNAGNSARFISSSNDVWTTFVPQSGNSWRIQATTGSVFGIYNENSATFPLTIASTGAATFSSSVNLTSAASVILLQGSSFGQIFATNDLYLDAGTSKSILLRPNNSTVALTLASTGAATFSSSVTTLGSVDITGEGNTLTLRKSNNIPALTFIGASSNTIIEGGNTFNLYTGGAGNRIFVTSGGNVGIGTPSPSTNLHLKSGSGSAVFRIEDSGGVSVGRIQANAGDGNINFFEQSGYALTFGTSNIERMRITAGGEVLIGNTDNGAYNLQCNGTGVWGAGAYVNGSDRNIKDNIATIEKGLEYIQKMNPVKFRYKPNYTRDHSMQTGFIAQELQEVFASEDYLSGLVQQGVHLSVAYQNLLPVLVKAIQEQQEIINDLKQKIK